MVLPLFKKGWYRTSVVVKCPFIYQGPVENLEIFPAFSKAASNGLFRYIMSTHAHPKSNPANSKVGIWQAEKKKLY